jgi:SNF2 family DNA or RNA helicase
MATWRDDMRNYINTTIGHQLTEESPHAEQPSWITTPLRPHQLTLLAAARELEKRADYTPSNVSASEPYLLAHYGTLADRVGAGKTLVALSLVRDPPVVRSTVKVREDGGASVIHVTKMSDVSPFLDTWTHLGGEELFKQMFPTRYSNFHTKASLAIVPHTVISQWEAYIANHTTLNAVIVRRTADCEYDRAGFYQKILTSDLVVVSNTMLKKFYGALEYYRSGMGKFVWSRLFIDEADTIMGLGGHILNSIRCRFTWFITGSWLNMIYPEGISEHVLKLAEFEAIAGCVRVPGISTMNNLVAMTLSTHRDPRFTALLLRNSDEWVNTSLRRPTIHHEYVMCKAPKNLGILRDFITPAAMECLHAGDIAGAMNVMGLKAATKETLVTRVTDKIRQELQQAEKVLAFKREIEYSSPTAKTQAIQKAEERVTRIKGQLASLEERITAAAASSLCPICYDTPRTTTLTPCCRQAFCLSCLCECINKSPSCPLCRSKIDSVSELLVIGEEVAEISDEDSLPTKGAALLQLIANSSADQRFLVFSSHEASFKGLREMLSAKGINCELLSGAATRVEKLRRQFREGKIRVLCMNARHVGAGLNLESATHVVLYHRMGSELEKQVIGRAVRFERDEALHVIHLVHENETASTGYQGSEVIMHV